MDDARFELLRGLAVFVEEIDDGFAGLVDDPAADVGVAQLVFGLRLENRLLDLDGDDAKGPVADIDAVEGFLVKLVDAFEHALAERALVGAAVGRVLAVDKGAVGLAVAVDVREGKFEVLALVVRGRIELRIAGLAFEQVEQALFGLEFLAVEVQAQTSVEAGVVPQPALDEFVVEVVFAKDVLIGQKLDVRAVGLVGRSALLLLFQFAALKEHFGAPTVAVGADDEVGRKRVDGLGADAVEPHAELEDVVVVFGTGVDDRDALDDFAEGNAAAVVADLDSPLVDLDVDLLATAHDELINGIVDDLLEQYVDAIVGIGTRAEPTDVHAGPQADVFE